MKWDDAQTERLKSLWMEGYSATQIGEKFGLTKGQIMGRAYRVGLSEKDKKVDPASALTLWQERRERRYKIQIGRVRKSRKTSPRKRPEPKPVPAFVECIGIALPELKRNQCRFISGEVRGIETRYCGNKIHGESSYCPYHFHLCYQPAKARSSPALVPA